MAYFKTESLNQIKQKYGTNYLVSYYNKILKINKYLAIALINDNTLSFSTLFPLIQMVIDYKLFSSLNAKNKLMLKIYFKSINNPLAENEIDPLIPINDSLYYSTLVWIVQDCEQFNEINDAYNRLIDLSFSLLLLKYKDKSVIKAVVALIFKRNKGGLFYHDLVWALFELNDYEVINAIVQYLKSPDQNDITLAHKLLKLNSINTINTYDEYSEFTKQNLSYIYFTKQTFNLSSEPIFFDINLEAKYLHKPSLLHTTDPSSLLTPKENSNLLKFHELKHDTQLYLSDYSDRIYQHNKRLWRAWNNFDIDNQIAACEKGMGGLYD